MLHFNLGDIIVSAEFSVASSCHHKHSWRPDCPPQLVVDCPCPQSPSHSTSILPSVQGAHLVPHFKDWACFARFLIETRDLGSSNMETLFPVPKCAEGGPNRPLLLSPVSAAFLSKKRILCASAYWRDGRLLCRRLTPSPSLCTRVPLTGR